MTLGRGMASSGLKWPISDRAREQAMRRVMTAPGSVCFCLEEDWQHRITMRGILGSGTGKIGLRSPMRDPPGARDTSWPLIAKEIRLSFLAASRAGPA